MSNPRPVKIVKIAWGVLHGTRPRHAGRNARLDDHGTHVRLPLAQITTDDGATGFGRSSAGPTEAAALLGASLDTLFDPTQGAIGPGLAFDFPLWDLAAKRAGLPVYALAAQMSGSATIDTPAPRVPTYDTSLYFDDLHLADDAAAAAHIAGEAREGWARGHRAFKIKVGRGARHMPLAAGTRRDIAVIKAVREAVGPQAPLMIDANNGYNLNLTKEVLLATADAHLFWLEEAFHEDRVLYADLRAWCNAQGLAVLFADGEGQASPTLLDWAREGLVQVVQYDIFSYGFTPWLALGRQLDAWGVQSAPHHYGAHFGNYAACHLAPSIRGFTFAEWDEVVTPGLDASGYTIEEGRVSVPQQPGFGLGLDPARFTHAVTTEGYYQTL
jgi:L-alanine-DL-glutamate epimerase-like enolase superfamily enzyme